MPAARYVNLDQIARIGHQHFMEPAHHFLGPNLGMLRDALAALPDIVLHPWILQQPGALRCRRGWTVACGDCRPRGIETRCNVLPCKATMPLLRAAVLTGGGDLLPPGKDGVGD